MEGAGDNGAVALFAFLIRKIPAPVGNRNIPHVNTFRFGSKL